MFAALLIVSISAVLFVLRGPIADLFQAEGVTRQLVFLFCGPLALAFFFNAVIFVGNASFNNLGHPFYSTWLTGGRHTGGTVPFVIAGAAIMGAPGVLIGQAAGGAIFAVITIVLARRVMTNAEAADAGARAPFQREARQHSLLNHRR